MASLKNNIPPVCVSICDEPADVLLEQLPVGRTELRIYGRLDQYEALKTIQRWEDRVKYFLYQGLRFEHNHNVLSTQ